MTITFENQSDVITYAFERIISHARRTQQIFVAQCIWWLASIIGLGQGLVIHIDNLRARERLAPIGSQLEEVHPDRIQQILSGWEVSTTPRDLTEDSRFDRILESAEKVVQESSRDRAIVQQGRVNPLPVVRSQLKKARKLKPLQEANRKKEDERIQRLRRLRDPVIRNLSKE